MKHKKLTLSLVVAILLVATGYYFFIFAPHQKAVARFDKAVKVVKNKNKPLNQSIVTAEKLIKSKEEPLDNNTLTALKTTVADSKKELRKIPKMANSTDEIDKQTKSLKKPLDYTKELANLDEKATSYQNSVKQLKQITKPDQAFIESRLKEIDTIADIQSVTETNDPNGQLNKQGGYTASVYFVDKQVTQPVDGKDVVDKGNDAGGDIEVYATKEDAEKRNIYLSAFDGNGFLNPGSHQIYGTVIIRTSQYLTASQQNELTQKIYNKLIELK